MMRSTHIPGVVLTSPFQVEDFSSIPAKDGRNLPHAGADRALAMAAMFRWLNASCRAVRSVDAHLVQLLAVSLVLEGEDGTG